MKVRLLFQFSLIFFSTCIYAQGVNSEIVLDSQAEDTLSSDSYIHISYFSAFRTFKDESSNKKYSKRLDEKAISTSGIEIGKIIKINQQFNFSIGVTFFGGGESYQYSDNVTDSTFYYKNVYHQIGIPIRLNFEMGNKVKGFVFAGVVPASILHRRYESNYTDEKGKIFENEIETFKNDLAMFQISGSFGGGIKYSFKNTTLYAMGEYRPYFSNTYTGLFLSHQMRLIGGSFGMIYSFK